MQASAECASSQAVMAAERGGEAASLVGRRVLKKFTGYGTHTGTVVAQLPADSDERSPTHNEACFLVHYEDGDTEHMSATELERCLQPLDRGTSLGTSRTLQADRNAASCTSESTPSEAASSEAAAAATANCSICMSSFSELPVATPVVQLPRCEHVFCHHCIEGWWSTSAANSCPACRTVYSGIRRCTMLTAGAVLVEPSITSKLDSWIPSESTPIAPAGETLTEVTQAVREEDGGSPSRYLSGSRRRRREQPPHPRAQSATQDVHKKPCGLGDDHRISRFVGVSWTRTRDSGRWHARLQHEKQLHNLGYFDEDDEEAAARAFDAAARRLRGPRAHGGRSTASSQIWRLNFPTDAEQLQVAAPASSGTTNEPNAEAAVDLVLAEGASTDSVPTRPHKKPRGLGDDRRISSFVGVSWNGMNRKWKVQIEHEKQRHNLGYFDEDDEEAAARAFDAAARRLRGPRAHGGRSTASSQIWRLNFPTDAEQLQVAAPASSGTTNEPNAEAAVDLVLAEKQREWSNRSQKQRGKTTTLSSGKTGCTPVQWLQQKCTAIGLSAAGDKADLCERLARHGLGRAPIEDTLTEVMQALDDLIKTVEHSSSSSGSYGHNKAHSEHNASQSSKLCFHDLEGGMEYEIVWTEAGRQSWFRVHVVRLSADEAVLRYLDTGEQETLHREEWTPGCLRNQRAIACRPKAEPSHPRAELPNDTDTDTARSDQGTQFTAGPAGLGDDRPVSRFTGVRWEARLNRRGKWKAQIKSRTRSKSTI